MDLVVDRLFKHYCREAYEAGSSSAKLLDKSLDRYILDLVFSNENDQEIKINMKRFDESVRCLETIANIYLDIPKDDVKKFVNEQIVKPLNRNKGKVIVAHPYKENIYLSFDIDSIQEKPSHITEFSFNLFSKLNDLRIR